ncbi:hypothetical protein [Amorphus sp. 3PC139-8]|uniref:hypothetical protein n=1 Tax=Amorphus sp. 3PC139-8 TaxID=2735676 RepID=UPI00345D9D40
MKRVVTIGIAAFAIFGAIAWFYFLAVPDNEPAPDAEPGPPEQQIVPDAASGAN